MNAFVLYIVNRDMCVGYTRHLSAHVHSCVQMADNHYRGEVGSIVIIVTRQWTG